MNRTAWDAYNEASKHFFDTYEGLAFDSVHADLIPYLPQAGASCLDVGSGSGRDAAALASRGLYVTAVEPGSALRELAAAHHSSPNIQWIDDSLPRLSTLAGRQGSYDFILLSAVWMHVHPHDRSHALGRLSTLLASEGRLAITLRLGMPAPERIMHEIDTNAFLTAAKDVGLEAIHVGEVESDSLRRGDVAWQRVVLCKVG